jgi:hypothetical protein
MLVELGKTDNPALSVLLEASARRTCSSPCSVRRRLAGRSERVYESLLSPVMSVLYPSLSLSVPTSSPLLRCVVGFIRYSRL